MAGLVLAFGLRRLESPDFWWQLRLGQYINELKEVPVKDVFTSTAEGRDYIDSHWLFQVGLWRVYRALGINGVIIGVALTALVTWLCVLATYWCPRAYGLALVAMLLGVVAASERYLPRPDLISLLFLSMTHWALARYRDGGARWVYLLPVVQLLWVNTHGLWILGPILLGVYLVTDALAARLPLPGGWRWWCLGPREWRGLAVVWLATILVAFITPQPLEQIRYPLTLFEEIRGEANWVATSVTELAEPLAESHWPLQTWAFLALAVLLAGTWLRNWRRLDLAEVVACCAFGYLALTARRNMALFAVLAVPAVPRNWAAAGERGARQDETSPAQPILAFAAAALAMVVAWTAATNRLWIRQGSLTRFGLGLSETQYPGRLGDFIRAANVPGPVWNTPGLGGYLLWRFWPERPVYIDGRWEIYGENFLKAYGRTIRDPRVWQESADAMGIQAAAILHRRGDYANLLRYLQASAEWALCYADEVAVLYVRRAPANRALVAAYEVPLEAAAVPSALPGEPVVVWEDRYRDQPHFTALARRLDQWPPRAPDGAGEALVGNLFFTLEADAAAEAWFIRAVAADPDNYAARLSLGYLSAAEANWRDAVAHYRVAAEARPWEVEPWLRLGEAALRVGDLRRAREAFVRARDLRPDSPQALAGLGRVALLEGDRAAAEEYLREVRALAPSHPAVGGLEAALKTRRE